VPSLDSILRSPSKNDPFALVPLVAISKRNGIVAPVVTIVASHNPSIFAAAGAAADCAVTLTGAYDATPSSALTRTAAGA
jgi:hypothetical protein